MKRFYILTLCIIIAVSSSAQLSFLLQTSDLRNPVLIKVANNDVVYVCNSLIDRGLIFIRFNSQNKIKVSRLIAETRLADIQTGTQSVIETSDKGFVIAGLESKSNVSYRNLIVIKCDSAGNLLWQKRINNQGAYLDAASPVVCEAPDKSLYVAAGNYFLYHQLIKFNSKGQVLWHKRYQYHSNGVLYNYTAITADADNVYFAINAGVCQECWYDYSDIYKVSKDGNVVWEKKLGDRNRIRYIQSLGNDEFNMFIEKYSSLRDSRYVAGTFNFNNPSITGNTVAKDIFSLTAYAKKNNLVFLKGLEIIGEVYGKYHYKNLVNDDWSVYTVTDSNLCKYDTLNRICPDYTVPAFDTTITKFGTRITDNNPIEQSDDLFTVIIPVYTSTPVSIEYDLICSGTAPAAKAAVASSLKTTVLTVSISPNPVKDVMTVNSNSLLLKTIIVTNASGKAVLKDAFTGKQKNINVSSLTPGIYYIRILETNGYSQAVKIVKQ